MAKAETNIFPWLARREAVAHVARHLGCTPEDAELRIVDKVNAGQIGVTSEGCEVPPLPAVRGGVLDEIADNVRLCSIDLVAAGLLPAPAERARWPAEEAVAYLIKGVPLPWKAWQGAGATASEIEQAGIDLGEAICEGVPAWGRPGPFAPEQLIPADSLHSGMIENKTLPVSIARPPKVLVDCGGYVTTSPRQRFADYRGPRWEAIEVDSAALRQARPRPLTTQTEPVTADPAPAASGTPGRNAETTSSAPAAASPTAAQIEPASPAPPKITPQAWYKKARDEDHPRQRGEWRADYVRRLYPLMKAQAANLTRVWPFGTLRRQVYREPEDEPAKPATKARRSIRTC